MFNDYAYTEAGGAVKRSGGGGKSETLGADGISAA